METFDIHHLPPPVHDALLCLVEALAKAWPAPTAEAGLGAVPPEAAPPRFPRSDTEMRILDALQQLAPLPATPRQIAAMLGMPPEQVRLLLQALATLGTVEHPAMGYYRQKGAEAVETSPLDASPSTAVPWPREAREQRVLAAVRAAFPRAVSPSEIYRELGIAQARVALIALTARGQVERIEHGRYRYRPMRSPEDGVPPSVRFATQIAALCTPSTSRGPTA
jgi:predicted transcriptional regulator of viral defense system